MNEEYIIQEKILEIQAKAFVSKLPYLNKLHGLKCKLYAPDPYNGGYDNDGKRIYVQEPFKTTQFVIFNYFQIGQFTYDNFDPFSETQKSVLTKPSDKIPQNTKIVVYQGTSYYQYRVDNFKTFRGKDGLILIENLLIPHI